MNTLNIYNSNRDKDIHLDTNSSTKIKICGLTSPAEARYLNENHVDFAGMVLFFPKSKRNISIEQAKDIMAALDASIKRVAVVVSPSIEQIRQIEDKQLFNFLLHSDTSLSLFFTLSRCAFKPAAFSFREESSLRIEGFFSCVSFFAENSLKAAVSTSASRPLKNTR